MSNESSGSDIYIKRFPEGGGQWQVSVDGGVNARWGEGEIFYVSLDNTLMAVPVDTRGPTPQIGNPQPLFTARSVRGVLNPTIGNNIGWGYDVTTDGQRFVVIQEVDTGEDSRDMTMVVENWVRAFEWD